MTLREYAERILSSSREDWTVNVCWGAGAGPSYRERIVVWSTNEGNFINVEVESHSGVASLNTDLSISIAWGFPINPNFKEPWANNFPNPSASSNYVDFFYNGGLVFRDIYVSVDGGRCIIPLPHREFDEKTQELTRLTVLQDQHRFIRLLDSFERLSDFDRYFAQTGIEITEKPWMA